MKKLYAFVLSLAMVAMFGGVSYAVEEPAAPGSLKSQEGGRASTPVRVYKLIRYGARGVDVATLPSGVVYAWNGRQVGQATSGCWSPTLKANLALASVEAAEAEIGRRLQVEVTAEFQRRRVTARVTATPFFDPPRKRSDPS